MKSNQLFFPLTAILSLVVGPVLAASSISKPWQQYIFSPSTRNPSPKSIYRVVGNATVQHGDLGFKLSMLAGSHVSLDFGVEVGGHVSFDITADDSLPVSLAFSESPEFVRSISDDTGAVPTENYDMALNISVNPGTSFYITPKDSFRGGFRFLTINALADVTISNVTCEIGFAPNMENLRDYSGYFYTADPDYEVLNKIWYAGAYTVQTNIAPQDTGRFLPQVKPGWDYNASLGIAAPVLLDGAKRDRAIWPGDLGVSGTSAFLALGPSGLEAFGNALATIFYFQNASTGEFPYAGPDTASFQSGSQSDTYHAWSLISIYNYAMYSGNETWLNEHWANVTRGVEFLVSQLDSATGLENQTQPNDWGRQGAGGFNSALNALDYHGLVSIASLANDTQQAQTWQAAAMRLKDSYNAVLWDYEAGLFRDNQTTALHPQDGNSLALAYNLTLNTTQASSMSANLLANWNTIGPVTPELPDTISPFVSGLELLGHYQAGQPNRGLELVERLWGHLLSSPILTGSTFVEGITANGSLYYRSTAGYNYDAAYTSLSHGWSTAPVQALLFDVLGLQITGIGGKTWKLVPQLGGLKDVRGGFVAGLGSFEAHVVVTNGGQMQIELQTPEGTEGVVDVAGSTMVVDGQSCIAGGNVKGGKRTIVAKV